MIEKYGDIRPDEPNTVIGAILAWTPWHEYARFNSYDEIHPAVIRVWFEVQHVIKNENEYNGKFTINAKFVEKWKLQQDNRWQLEEITPGEISYRYTHENPFDPRNPCMIAASNTAESVFEANIGGTKDRGV